MRTVILAVTMLLVAGWVIAEEAPVVTYGGYKDSHFFHNHYRTMISEGYADVHDATREDKRDFETGAGIDVLIVESKGADVVGEYKYDWANGEQQAYVVLKTKKSLWSVVKGWFNGAE